MEELPFGTDDDKVTTEIDASDYLDAKLAAMRAHATQIAVDSPFFALSDKVGSARSAPSTTRCWRGSRARTVAASGPVRAWRAGLPLDKRAC